jgi:hypothetical protein
MAQLDSQRSIVEEVEPVDCILGVEPDQTEKEESSQKTLEEKKTERVGHEIEKEGQWTQCLLQRRHQAPAEGGGTPSQLEVL